jgi:integrase
LTHIRRKKIYKQIKEEALKIGQEAVPYSFRHRYAKESHASGFPINNIAEAMGHTQEVHLQNYGRFKPSGTTDLYSNRNKQTA